MAKGDNHDMRDVWVVYTNTDLTEGRGRQYPLHICETEVVAQRMAKGAYVMGTDAPIEKDFAFKIDGKWYAPIKVEEENAVDKEVRIRREARSAAIAKALAAGITQADIDAIGGKLPL